MRWVLFWMCETGGTDGWTRGYVGGYVFGGGVMGVLRRQDTPMVSICTGTCVYTLYTGVVHTHTHTTTHTQRFFVRLKLQHAREEDKFVVFDYFINSGVGEFIIERYWG